MSTQYTQQTITRTSVLEIPEIPKAPVGPTPMSATDLPLPPVFCLATTRRRIEAFYAELYGQQVTRMETSNTSADRDEVSDATISDASNVKTDSEQTEALVTSPVSFTAGDRFSESRARHSSASSPAFSAMSLDSTSSLEDLENFTL